MKLGTLLVLAALAATPLASAGWFDNDPPEATVAPAHVGDRLLFRIESHAWDTDPEWGYDESETRDRVVLLEAAGTAVDRFGILRDVENSLFETTSGGELEERARCSRLASGLETVATAWMEGSAPKGGGMFFGGTMLDGSEEGSFDMLPILSYGGAACPGTALLSGTTLREGDAVTLASIDPEAREQAISSPSILTSFEDRTAFEVAFTQAQVSPGSEDEGYLRLVFADGLPGPARWSRASWSETSGSFRNVTLVGYVPGDGPEIAAPGDERLPERAPDATFSSDVASFDDSALEIAFPFAKARAILLQNPAGEGARWLAAHPEAYLGSASYDAQGSDGTGLEGPVWWLLYVDGDEFLGAEVFEARATTTPLGRIPLPQGVSPPPETSTQGETFGIAEPAEVLDGAGIGAALARAGVTGEIRGLDYSAYLARDGSVHAMLSASQISKWSKEVVEGGREASLELTTGATKSVMELRGEYSADGGILMLESGPTDLAAAPKASAFAILARPTEGAGLAVTATITGLALLALALLPLYSRLRRDRLLDNPVRAKLYDRIRAEPGIHLAELEEFLGIGKGATKHHVDQLADHGFVFLLEDGGFTRAYASGHVPRDAALRHAALRAGSAARVYEHYAAHPETSLREAARELGMAAPSVHRAKKRLEKAGLLPAAPSASVAEA